MKFISDLDTDKMVSDVIKQFNYKTKNFTAVVEYGKQGDFIEKILEIDSDFSYIKTFCKFYIATKKCRYTAARGTDEIIFERGDLL